MVFWRQGNCDVFQLSYLAMAAMSGPKNLITGLRIFFHALTNLPHDRYIRKRLSALSAVCMQ